MTQAQKIAKEKFKKAIAYRKKTGATLKEAFAFVYGRKVSPEKKKAAPKKKAAVKKVVAVKKKAAPKKKAALKKIGAKHKKVDKIGNIIYTDYLQVKEKINSPGQGIKIGKTMILIYSKLLGNSTQSLYIRKAISGGLYISQKGSGGQGAGDIAKLFETKSIEVNSNLYKKIEMLAKKANAFI